MGDDKAVRHSFTFGSPSQISIPAPAKTNSAEIKRISFAVYMVLLFSCTASFLSRRGESDSRPFDYHSSALPLSYAGVYVPCLPLEDCRGQRV